jgi:hypothetical protein
MGACCSAANEIDSSDDEVTVAKKNATGCCGMKKGAKKEKIDKMGCFGRTNKVFQYEEPGNLGGDTA